MLAAASITPLRMGLIVLDAFRQLNELVFDGTLPRVPVYRADLTQYTAWGAFWPDSRSIQIERTLTTKQARIALLHEMVHLEQSIKGQAVHHNNYFRRRAKECLSLTGWHI